MQNQTIQNGKKERDEKQASGKQLVGIVFILALAAKMFLMPVFLIRATGRDAYIALAIDGGIDLAALGLMLFAMHLAGDSDFFALMRNMFGTVGSRIASALAGAYLLFKLNIAVAETLSFYGDSVFSDFNHSVMLIALTVFLLSVGSHTLRSLCRLNELLVPLIVICVVALGAIAVLTDFDLANIFPAMRDPKGFAEGAINHSVWLGDFTPLALFIGRTRIKKPTYIAAATAGVIGTAISVFFALIMCAAFGNVPLLADSSTNLSGILQFSMGNVYGKIDIFTSALWSVASFIEVALFFYSAVRCIEYTVGRAAHRTVSAAVSAILFAVQIFAFTDPTVFGAVVMSPISSGISAAFTFCVPVAAVIGGAISRRRDKPSALASEESV